MDNTINNRMDVQMLSQLLAEAELQKKPIEPLSNIFPCLTVMDAYKIQFYGISQRKLSGQSIVGYKIGLTNENVQKKFHTNEPDFGHLMNNMRIAYDDPCRTDILISPKIECEIAFSLKKSLKGPGISAKDILDATEFIAPAFEIVDSRILNWQNKLTDTISDNGSSGKFYIGKSYFDVHNFDFANTNVVMYRNGEYCAKGHSSYVNGSPLNAVTWLANYITLYDRVLKPGDIILSGAFFPPYQITSGDVFTADFDGLDVISLCFC